jgi:hypothetical protein
MPDEERRSNSFVVRVWWERAEEHQSFWRGWVQHAASGEICYFRRLSDLLGFIEAHTGSLAQGPGVGSIEAGKGGGL